MRVEPSIDITAGQRKTILTLLERHLPGTEAWVYGSRANWTSRPESDLDLVVFASPVQSRQIGNLREAFEESNLPFRVELFVWDDVPRQFKQQIEQERVILRSGQTESGREPESKTEWHEGILGDLIQLKRGYDLPQRERRQGTVPVVSSSGVTDHHCTSKVKGPGVVTGRYGTLGQVYFLPNDFWPLNTTLYVHDFKGNNPRFVNCFLRGLDFSAYSDKAAVPGLNRNHLHQMLVRFPINVVEQRAIAHILGTLDDRIELSRRMSVTLEAMARALFKSWFVDFDPVRAKMEGRDTGLPRHLAELFPDWLVDSELGEIPKGWSRRTLDDLIDLHYGKSLKRDKRVPGDFPVYGSGGSETSHAEALVRLPTVVVGRKGTVGSVYWAPRGCWPIDTTYFVTSDLPMIFIYRLLQHLPLTDMNTDVAVPGLNRSNAYRLEVPYPGIELVSEFARYCDGLQAFIDANERDVRLLAQMRDTLLPKLISGDIRIHDTERLVGEIA